jgi:flagellar M-ring protein FliF
MTLSLLKNLSKAKIAAIVGATLSALVLMGILVYSMSQPKMVPLFGELSQEDMSMVVAKLQAMGKPYMADETGKTILVSVNDVLPLRMQLAQDGIPSESQILGYEIFDKQDILGTSQFVNNVNEMRALEGELTRTINSLSEIDQSRVHIVVPKSDYFSKSGPEASASVFVKVKQGRRLSESQVNGIANLVTAAVPGLMLDKISIVDQSGKPLKTPGENQDSGNSKNITEYKSNIETRLKKAVEDLVGKYVGIGKVQANVTAEIDFDKIVINQEEYLPDSQVIRSERNSSENSNDTEMDKNVSVGTNLPNFLQKPQPNSIKQYNKDDGIVNYEVSKTITNKVVQWGAITQLSVAVLVDGVYDKDQATQKEVYIRDRTAEELAKIKQLVSAAIGADENRGDRVEVMNLQFAQENLFSESPSNLPEYDLATIAQMAIILVILIVAGIIFMKPKLIKVLKKAQPMSNDSIPQSLSSRLNQNTTDEQDTTSKPFAEKQYRDLLGYLSSSAADNIDDTVKVIRNWILQK